MNGPPEPIPAYAGTTPEATPTTAEGLLCIEDRCLREARGFASRTPGA